MQKELDAEVRVFIQPVDGKAVEIKKMNIRLKANESTKICELDLAKLKSDVFVASHHKKELLEEMIKKHGLSLEQSYAIGDTLSDAPMLSLVKNAIAFNPDKKLYKLALENNWQIVVERKNVVYEL